MRSNRTALAFCSICVLVLVWAWCDAALAETTRISVSAGGTEGNNMSQTPSISTDGRYVVFQSQASNLVLNDTNGETDIFIYDRTTKAIERVNLAADGTQANDVSAFGAGRNIFTGAPVLNSVNGNGRYVVFMSEAQNLLPPGEKTTTNYDIFVKDRVSGAIQRVSGGIGADEANAISEYASISPDDTGRYVVFASRASNLVATVPDTNGSEDVFLYDRNTAKTEFISVGTGGTIGDDESLQGVMSADGNLIAFTSSAGNLVSSDTNNCADVFVRDRVAGTTTRVSVSSSGAEAITPTDGTSLFCVSGMPSISADGRFVAFESTATNLVPDDTNGRMDIFLRDRQAGTTTRVSVSADGKQIYGDSYTPSISADGHYIAYVSGAKDILPNSIYGDTLDVFIYDRISAAVVRANVSSAGEQDNHFTLFYLTPDLTISGDGSVLAFSSFGTNLVAGDLNRTMDVFTVTDECLSDPAKILPGTCGCSTSDVDTDEDGTPDCHDACPLDPLKTVAGVCGCGKPDSDLNANGAADCLDPDGNTVPAAPTVTVKSKKIVTVTMQAFPGSGETYALSFLKKGKTYLNRTTPTADVNTLTIRTLKPGKYTVKYRVVLGGKESQLSPASSVFTVKAAPKKK
jgi:Tol biopolymer transport system component